MWSQEEKLNYHSTPMFMISAVKKEKDIWSENDGMGDSDSGYDRKRDLEDAMLCAAPGMKKSGFLRLGGGEFSLPDSTPAARSRYPLPQIQTRSPSETPVL